MWWTEGTGLNPPNIARLPNNIEHIKQYYIDTAYIGQQGESESRITYKKRLYLTMLYYVQTPNDARTMRIQQLWPKTNWNIIWSNLHETPISDHQKAEW
jgi:hypothetical protein